MSAPIGSPAILEIDESRRGAASTLMVTGELDLTSSIKLIEVTRRALRRRPARLTLDLAGIAFVDITGVRALIACRRLASAADTDFDLINLSRPVRRLLESSRLDVVFCASTAHDNGNGRGPNATTSRTRRAGPDSTGA